MSPNEMILLLQKNDKVAMRLAFDQYYQKLAAISARFSKNTQQAEEMINYGFHQCLSKLRSQALNLDLDKFIEREFVKQCIQFIKNIRSEYYVASTVYANGQSSKLYDLFENNEPIDYKNLKKEVIIQSLQKLVPSQRLVFNLAVIDGYTPQQTAEFLESSIDATRSNLEKARYNFQRNVENCIRTAKT